MTRAVWAGLVLCVIGCRGAHYYAAAPVLPPPVSAADATCIVIEDWRPEWERKPFSGAANLYPLSKVAPSPFEQIKEEANAAVAAMAEKPANVTIKVTSCRLVLVDEERLRNELRTGSAEWFGICFHWYWEKPEDLYPKGVTEHPDGASCSIEATVTMQFANKPEQTFAVKSIATGQNVSGTAYQGEALELAARMAAFQFGRQFRTAVGLKAD